MRALRHVVGVAGGLAILISGTGCGSPAKDQQIDAQMLKIAELERSRKELLGQLAAWADAADKDAQEIRDLEAQLAAARERLEAQPETIVTHGDWMEAPGIAWTNIASDILFDSGEVKLKPAGKDSLRSAAGVIQERYPDRDIWVVGHTDTDPLKRVAKLYQDNLELSQERGRVVALELMALGIEKARIVAAGQGQFKPVAPNDKTNKARNRRVEIIAVMRPENGPTPDAREG